MPEINTTLGVYKGSNSVYQDQDISCGTLKEINDDNEKLFNGGEKQGKEFTESYCNRKEESHTFATMFLKDEGEIYQSYSDLSGRPMWFKEGMVQGQSAADRTKKNPETGEYDNTKLCDGSKFKYNGDPNMLGGHTEARFLTELAGLGSNSSSVLSGKKIVFNILWKNKNGEPPNAPCIDCFKMMCAALDCGAEIEVCGQNGEPYSVKDDCSNPDKDKGYAKYLEKITQESSTPIRNIGRRVK